MLVVFAVTMTGVATFLGIPQREREIVAPKVYAFYYPWYGNPQAMGGSGKLAHWAAINVEKQRIADSTNYPALGPYDSHDEKLIGQHTQWAREAGVDGFIVSWWGQGHFTDQALERLLDGGKRAGLEMTIYYERVRNPQNAQTAADEILEVLHRYADHPAWMRHEGKPVVFVYGRTLHEIGLETWAEVVRRVNAGYPGGAVLIGDRQNRKSARIFAGIHKYNAAWKLNGMRVDELQAWARATYPKWVRTAERAGRISTVTVIPGYDDKKIRKPGLRVERFGGDAYRAQWEAAISAKPDWVLITSWNEWHEGSEIEPSVEHGDAYLKMTAEFAARFKAAGGQQVTQPH